MPPTPSPSDEDDAAGEIEGRSSQSSKGSPSSSKSSSSSKEEVEGRTANAIGDDDFAERQLPRRGTHGAALLAGGAGGETVHCRDVEATA